MQSELLIALWGSRTTPSDHGHPQKKSFIHRRLLSEFHRQQHSKSNGKDIAELNCYSMPEGDT